MKYFHLAAFIVLWSLFSIYPASAREGVAQALPPEVAEEIRTYVEDRYKGDGAGVSVLVARDGHVIFESARGCANCEFDIPNGSNIAYRIGSISKAITAIELLRFSEQGSLELHAPIGTYMPDLPEHMARVTAFQLMSHTSGLADHVFDPDILPFIRSGMSNKEILDMHADTPVRFEPGSRYEYVNFNYTLLGMLIEALSGESYSDYMEQELFATRGLHNSANDDRRDLVRYRAQNYHEEDGVLLHAENVDLSHVGAAGQLLMSPSDLVRWFQLLMDGELVSPETRSLAWTEVIPADGEGGGYGLGFNIAERNGETYIYHTGLTPGSHAAVGIIPADKLIVVVASNGFHLPRSGKAVNDIVDLIQR
ncbi:MAG: serine hydrolase domain-containing protein [Pseudomonadota bacterium]